MEREIIWSNPAKDDLIAIFDFIRRSQNKNKAFDTIEKLVRIGKLLSKPMVGSTRYVSALNTELDYQKIVWSHYLIIFRIENDKRVYVNRVFDSRQNPKKLNL